MMSKLFPVPGAWERTQPPGSIGGTQGFPPGSTPARLRQRNRNPSLWCSCKCFSKSGINSKIEPPLGLFCRMLISSSESQCSPSWSEPLSSPLPTLVVAILLAFWIHRNKSSSYNSRICSQMGLFIDIFAHTIFWMGTLKQVRCHSINSLSFHCEGMAGWASSADVYKCWRPERCWRQLHLHLYSQLQYLQSSKILTLNIASL